MASSKTPVPDGQNVASELSETPGTALFEPDWGGFVPEALTERLLRYFGWACLALVVLACVGPVVIVVASAFSDGGLFHNFQPTIGPWTRAIGSSDTLNSIVNSFLLSLRVPVALVISFMVGWYLARNDVFAKRTIMFALWLGFFLPILPATLGWILLLDPNYGIINKFFEGLGFIHGPILNIYSLMGITWVHITLTTIPIIVILIEPAQRFIDASYEEASTMAGAGIFTTLWRVTVPLIAPTLLTAFIAGTIRSLEGFEVEQLLGVPNQIFVYSTRIYNLLRMEPPDQPQAMALSTFFLVILVALVFFYRTLLVRANMTATLTGKGARLVARQRTRKSYIVSAILLVAIAIMVLVPFSMVVVSSLSRVFGFFNIAHPWTLEHWAKVFDSPDFVNALRQSMITGLLVAILGTTLYISLAWFIARRNFFGKSALSLTIWLPWALPGVLLGTAFLTIFLNMPVLKLAYGTEMALVIVLIIQGLPFATHLFEASITQISRELEESSLVSGADQMETVRRITAPLITPVVVTVFVLSFMLAIKDISTTVLVATPGTQTLPLLMFGFALSGQLERASVVGVITVIIAMVMAFLATRLGDRATVMR